MFFTFQCYDKYSVIYKLLKNKYKMMINSMLKLLIISYLTSHLHAQTIQIPMSLQQKVKTYPSDQQTSNQFKVLNQLTQDHPHLLKYIFVSIDKKDKIANSINENNISKQIEKEDTVQQTYIIRLQYASKTNWIIAQFVSTKENINITFNITSINQYKPLNDTLNKTINQQQASQINSASIKIQQIKQSTISQTIKYPTIPPIGGWSQLSNFSQPSFKKALLYLQTEYPHLRNYKVIKVRYQLSSGTVYNITFHGNDRITQINITVHMSIANSKNKIFPFQVECLEKSINKIQNCSKSIAKDIFYANQLILQNHNEIKVYKLDEVNISKKSDINFEMTSIFLYNQKPSLKAISDVSIIDGKYQIVSFFIFPQ